MTSEQLILDLHRRRTGFGAVPAGTPTLRSPVCGDEITLHVSVVEGVIRSVDWTAHGCTVSLASASALAELAPGLPVADFEALRRHFENAVLFRGLPQGAPQGEPQGEPLADPPSDYPLAVDPRLGDAVAFTGIGRLPLRAGCATLAWRAATAALLPKPSVAPAS